MNNPTIKELVARNALFIVNHSGGKDSQAMTIEVLRQVPASQVLVIHAALDGVEFEGTEDHVYYQAELMGLEAKTCRADKTFIQMVERRGMWPSPQYRQCTSDLKRGPIEKIIRAETKARGNLLVVNCMGLRAEESSSRAKAVTFKFSKRNSKAGREWYDWLPIHDWSKVRVFAEIKDAGQVPHWAYAAGMSRLSCCFCIMSSKKDLCTAAALVPDMYAQYVKLEKTIGHTMSMKGEGLESVTGIKVD